MHKYIAHRREIDGEEQPLHSHLFEVSKRAGCFASKLGLAPQGELIGLLHDLGKYSKEFQNYLNSATGGLVPEDEDYVDAAEKKGRIDHSSAGAQVIHRNLAAKGKEEALVAQILSLCVASHHSGLIDCLSPDGRDLFSSRMRKSDERTHTDEAVSSMEQTVSQKLQQLLSDKDLILPLIQKLRSISTHNDSEETVRFKCGLLVRFLFSCLIDADRLDTADFEFLENEQLRNHGKYPKWDILVERLERRLKEFKNTTKVDRLRADISRSCLDYSSRATGLYQLTVPTGGGKTLASLRFALNHANKHSLERIFYIIPYTSIIDQNARGVREILEGQEGNGSYLNKVVLEHHSNLAITHKNPNDIQNRGYDQENKKQKLLSENWDAPVVFTTNVQFLETLFGNGTRGARRMHQLANAIIIFDEVQTIPVKCVHLFNMAVQFLVQTCKSTVVLCTATQPLLDKVQPDSRALLIAPEQQMISNVNNLFQELKRVDVYDRRKPGGWSDDETAELANLELIEVGSVLIVVNTKSAAQNLYHKLSINKELHLFHLSTSMCPVHRVQVLERVKKLLGKFPVICISTQLIEAGVDIDFGAVIRQLAGLDSIAQAAGRCNRNGLMTAPGKVSIINPNNENLDRLIDIRIGREKAERVLDEFKEDPQAFDNDLIGPKAMERYYQYYFYERQNEMSYLVKSASIVGREDNLFELLSTNRQSMQEFQRVNTSSSPNFFQQSFQSAAKAFHAIESLSQGVIVPFEEEGDRIVNDLCASGNIAKQYRLLKLAQRYSVNMFPHQFENMTNKGAVHEVQKGTGVFYLDHSYYSNDFGWSEENNNNAEPYVL